MIVEFLEGGQFTLGFVTNAQGARGRMEVMLAGGRSLAISPARILVSAEADDPGDKAARRAMLADLGREREALAGGVDLDTLWAVLEGEGPEFGYKDLAGLSFGRQPGPDEISAILRAIQGDGLLFEFFPDKARRRDQGEVDRLRRARAESEEKRDFLAQGAEWLSGSEKGRVCPEPEGAERALGWLMGYVLDGEDSQKAMEAKELLSMASFPTNPAGAFKALVGVGRLNRHENLPYLRLGFKKDFDEGVLAEAAHLARNFGLDAGRRLDLTALPTATVDAPGTKEFDDAISLEPLGGGRVRLGLHIADVAALVPPDSLVDRWAMNLTSSIYLPEGRQGMLPDVLIETHASLKAGEARPAFSLLVTIDGDGRVLGSEFRPSLVHVDLQVSFARANEMLENGEDSMLGPLEALALKLLGLRLAKDGQNLGLPHLNVTLNAEGLPEIRLSDDGNRANVMVGELMVLANHLAAKTLMEASIPCPYRYQLQGREVGWSPPRDMGERDALALALAMRRQTGRVGVSLEPSTHHGLGLMPYTTFTSPMRRYLDLLVARQLRAHANGEEPPYDHQAMMNLAIPAEATQRSIRRMQNDRQRYWLAWYLVPRVGETFVGLVYDRRGRRARICVTDFLLEIELNNVPPEAQPGTDVLLKLAAVNPAPTLPGENGDLWKFELVSLP
ncbi:MAG: RNB domain-containing ribonuclease [Deltaproteobacteria bacterium]|nr:RNB domain-containing ribonuclease [Deltaproteobacteria bacterium]